MTISNPLTRWFSRLRYPQKFTLIGLIFTLALVGFGPLISQQFTRIDQYGVREHYGTLYLRPVQSALVGVLRHERLLARQALGAEVAAELAAAQADVDRALEAVAEADALYGQPLQTGDRVSDIQRRWTEVKAGATGHQPLTEALLGLISMVGDSSFLILDPDLDTYYLMDTVLLQMPKGQVLLGEISRLGEAVLAEGQLSAADGDSLTVSAWRLAEYSAALQANARKTLTENEIGTITARNAPGQLRPLLEQPLARAVAANAAVLEQLEAIRGSGSAVSAEAFAASVAAAVEANQQLYDGASEALEVGVLARQARYTSFLAIALIVAVLGVLAGFAVGMSVMRSVSRPLNQLVETARRLQTGDLTARAAVNGDDEVGKVALAFNSFVDTLNDLVGKLVDSASKLSSGTTEISAAANQMSAGAESQTQQAIRTSSAMEEIAATVKEVAANADSTARATQAAVVRARDGSAKVQEALGQLAQTNEQLQQLRVRSGEIDQLVRLIADIAAQTNILSLNAAIEAAGAGAAGARFDVVAEEIRKLAQRTAESTSRISGSVNQIRDEMQAAARRTSELAAQAEEVGHTLSDIVEGVSSINDMIASISTSTSQQSRAVEQVAVSLQVITQVSQQTAQAAHETASTIDDLSGLAQQMSATATQFKV